MDKLRPELRTFVEKFISKNSIRNVDIKSINVYTSLDLDLNLFDLDLDQFVSEFIEEFNIDHDGFDWKTYGYPEASFIVAFVRSFLNYKWTWVKWIAHKLYRPKILLKDLQLAIDTGFLL